MDKLLSAIKILVEQGPAILGALLLVLSALLGLAILIPGDVPDKQLQWCVDKLQWVVDLVKKFSVKGVILGKDVKEEKK